MGLKRYLLILSLIGLLVIAGCDGGSDDSYEEKPWLYVSVDAGSGGYARAYLKYSGDYIANAIFINGVLNNPDKIEKIPGLEPGSEVRLMAAHTSIGIIERTLTVPATVTDLSCDGGDEALEAWMRREKPTLTLTFNNGDADYYIVHVNRSGTGGMDWRSSPIIIDKAESDILLPEGTDSVSISVRGVNYTDFDDPKLSFGSQFSVEGFRSEPLTLVKD
ncbi:MAG TPA: hypothetical protein DD789_06580 [Firmicutes bacterium]|jgi:hypothetical protein|nr:hypothetical protein [Bacillota bacterium]